MTTRRTQWTDRSDADLGRLLVALEANLDDATTAAGVPGKAEKGYAALHIKVEIPLEPSEVKRPLELVQALTWNIDILERARESLVAECRRRS